MARSRKSDRRSKSSSRPPLRPTMRRAIRGHAGCRRALVRSHRPGQTCSSRRMRMPIRPDMGARRGLSPPTVPLRRRHHRHRRNAMTALAGLPLRRRRRTGPNSVRCRPCRATRSSVATRRATRAHPGSRGADAIHPHGGCRPRPARPRVAPIPVSSRRRNRRRVSHRVGAIRGSSPCSRRSSKAARSRSRHRSRTAGAANSRYRPRPTRHEAGSSRLRQPQAVATIVGADSSRCRLPIPSLKAARMLCRPRRGRAATR